MSLALLALRDRTDLDPSVLQIISLLEQLEEPSGKAQVGNMLFTQKDLPKLSTRDSLLERLVNLIENTPIELIPEDVMEMIESTLAPIFVKASEVHEDAMRNLQDSGSVMASISGVKDKLGINFGIKRRLEKLEVQFLKGGSLSLLDKRQVLEFAADFIFLFTGINEEIEMLDGYDTSRLAKIGAQILNSLKGYFDPELEYDPARISYDSIIENLRRFNIPVQIEV